MNKLTVSFIIIALNASLTIDALFECLLRQTYPHDQIEIILVDSCSTDDTKQKMQAFTCLAEDFMRVSVFDNPQKTLPCGWNVALNEVSGDAVLRVDAHVTFPDNFIELNVRDLNQGENICGGKVVSVPHEDNNWNNTLNEGENSMFGGSFAAFRHAGKVQYVGTIAFAIYRKAVFDRVGLYNEKLARTEDNEMHYRMKKAGYKFYYDPEIVSYRETRASLGALLRQKYLNGYWIGRTLEVEPRCFSLYHFVPFAFVLAIIIVCILLVYGLHWPALLLGIMYGLTDLTMSILALVSSTKRNYCFLFLPLLFLLLHVCYGVGTVVGIAYMIISLTFAKLKNK